MTAFTPSPHEATVGTARDAMSGETMAAEQVAPSSAVLTAPSSRTLTFQEAVAFEAGVACGKREALADLRAFVAELRARAEVAQERDGVRAATMHGCADELEERFLR